MEANEMNFMGEFQKTGDNGIEAEKAFENCSDMDSSLCPHREFCGGCTYQGVDYPEQLGEKEKEVRELFKNADIVPEKFDSIEGCDEEHRFAYRNKMEYTFGDLVKDGPMTLGMHKKKNFMSIITVDHCQLVHDDFNKILSFTLEFSIERGYKPYHKKRHDGLMRNLIVRRGMKTGEILINIVTASGNFSEEEYIKGLLNLKLENEIVGILRTVNDGIADAVNCDELRVLWGRDYYMEEILGLKFKVSAFSFFQTSVEAVERLYSQAINLIDDFESKIAFDLYCGTGTISQILALKAKSVLGVELVEEAVESARENATLNGLKNCEFIAGDVFEVLEEVDTIPEVLVVDPPRMGMTDKAVRKVASYGVPQIVYISCNPKTLVKNLVDFRALGYEVKYVKPFDNFAMTKHVETVCLLSRRDK